MSRLPAAKRDDLTPEHQQIWDRIHATRSGGGGPYSMLMHSPAMAQHFAATEDYFRNESLLPGSLRVRPHVCLPIARRALRDGPI